MLLESLRCPVCRASLDDGREALSCRGCGRRYSVEDGIARMLDDSLPGIAAKRREIAGWAELARLQGWYEPDDRVDLALPFLCRDLGWDDAVWRATEHSFSILLERFVRPGTRVLEVGAGKAWAALHLVPRGCEYVATDLVADASIGLGRGELYERHVGPFARIQADGEHLPFADGSFDLVYTIAALHHALDPARMARELARVTRRGGVVAALNEGTRPLRWSPDNPDQELERQVGINEHVHTLAGYVWSFLRAGLVPVRLERSDGYAPFEGRTRIQKLLRLPGGRTALTVALNLRAGYSGISLYARNLA